MYKQSFGLREAPFSVTPDPKFVFLSFRHRNALGGLTYGILSRKRFIVLTGDVGTGKTTLIATALRHLPEARTRFGVILNPTLPQAEVLEAILSALGVPQIPTSKVQRLSLLESLLKSDGRQGKITTLVIDEAHKLGPEALEEIRLVGNFDSLQIVLVGQSELSEVLNREELRPLKQRIAVRLSIEPLSAAEVGQYISHRWTTAGGQSPPPFSTEAIQGITQQSHGIPRLINTICDNALLLASEERVSAVSLDHVLQASTTLQLSKSIEATSAAVSASEHLSGRWSLTSLHKFLSRKNGIDGLTLAERKQDA
jgi:general secretion pathway protein A